MLASKKLNRAIPNFIGVYVIFMVLIAIFGGAYLYSPIPYWDMWGGYLDFFLRVNNGDYGVWWGQHNEHRIILSRLLFWLDLKWFGGVSIFLIVFNYLLAMASALVFCRILIVVNYKNHSSYVIKILASLIIIWLFSWVQNENFTWAFQSQFFLAYLLPLCSFYWAYKSTISEQSSFNFAVACCLGIASIGTMANGILTLPLLTLYALILRQGWKRVGIYLALSVVSILAYFYHYHSPAGHGSVMNSVRENPVGLIKYISLYMGSPFYYFFEGIKHAKLIAMLCGGFLIIVTSMLLMQSVKAYKKNAVHLAVILFLVYVIGTAFGTAGGRLIFGIDQALSGRYTTPAIMAWCSLLIMCSPWIVKSYLTGKKKLYFFLIGLFLLPLPAQLKVLSLNQNIVFERSVAGLSLEMGVKDRGQVEKIFPSWEYVEDVSRGAKKERLSFFGASPYIQIDGQIGAKVDKSRSSICEGNIEQISPMPDDKNYRKIKGWLGNVRAGFNPNLIQVFNSQGDPIGFTLGTYDRMSLDAIRSVNLQRMSFVGYVLADQMGSSINLGGPEGTCAMKVDVPTEVFSITTTAPLVEKTSLNLSSIVDGNQWLGSDFSRSSIAGMKIYGSYINSDSDTGFIVIKANRGDRLFYRSGPVGGRQILEISGMPPIVMPTASEWIMLDFTSPKLPKSGFEIKLSDNGADWGEWSAIAVSKSTK